MVWCVWCVYTCIYVYIRCTLIRHSSTPVTLLVTHQSLFLPNTVFGKCPFFIPYVIKIFPYGKILNLFRHVFTHCVQKLFHRLDPLLEVSFRNLLSLFHSEKSFRLETPEPSSGILVSNFRFKIFVSNFPSGKNSHLEKILISKFSFRKNLHLENPSRGTFVSKNPVSGRPLPHFWTPRQ
jgi:hypothetical protein